jgi:hypothetical protein
MNLAYVAASTHHSKFTFKDTSHGCLEFCRSLPGYSYQRALMRDEVSDNSSFKSAVI